jgi:CheY-like chemotaxis protein
MKTPRWLLPFMHGVDMRAIEYTVRLAESAGATLIPVSLITAPPKGARLEHLQQSKDFLEAVQHKAARYLVPVERYEVFTADAQQSITTPGTGCAGHGGTAVDPDRAAPAGMTVYAGRKEAIDMPGARILLVEDDEVLRELILRNLKAREHDVHVAGDARTALAHLRGSPYDLILLDICLPDQTGWDVLRVAQKQGWLSPLERNGNAEQLPVVVLSAVRVSPRRLLEFRPLAYLPKPFPMEAILRLAREAAQRRIGEADPEEEEEEDAESSYPVLPDEEELHA